jgi:hypothetical protein
MIQQRIWGGKITITEYRALINLEMPKIINSNVDGG